MWIACQDSSIAICDITTRGITRYCLFDELVKDGQLLKSMQTIDNRIVVLAYYHGMLAFIANESLLNFEPESSLLLSIDKLMDTDRLSKPVMITKYLENIGCLNTIEIISNDHQQFIWCGCDKGTIYIIECTAKIRDENFRGYKSGNLKMNLLKVASYSDKLDAEGNIIMLKSVFNSTLQKTVVYGLHETLEQESFVISCWLTDQTLQWVINSTKPGTSH